ncbi:uncharacterized protein G2W53_001774 [Senna tora]|uniref:Uncharacterized protein n=1 Tax=Senna tora TaxID=362788 RepID=A0A834XGK9_9FABA|nr:uncharacterized protein G2W53_001774 [Senna tora]
MEGEGVEMVAYCPLGVGFPIIFTFHGNFNSFFEGGIGGF